MPVIRREVSTVLRRHPLADSYFVSKFGAAPYYACEHACKYCDGRAEKYYVEGDFEQDIVVRSNFSEVFAHDIGKLRERGIVMFGSGVTDPYQPIEEHERLMRSAAETLIEARLPASVLTKSALIRRDLDLWSEVNRVAGFTLQMTIVTLDDRIRQVFEPGASPIPERLDTLRAFKSAGCGVGVMAMPLLPWICDEPAQLEELFGMFAEIGVDFVFPGGLTLRPGRQKETFLETLQSYAPHLVEQYNRLYRENRPSGAGLVARSEWRREIQCSALQRFGLLACTPHRLYRDRLSLADELYVLTAHLYQLYGGGNVAPLKAARKRYTEWLSERRHYVAHRRNLQYSVIDAQLREEFIAGRFRNTLQNDRLFEFLVHRVLDDMTFNYHTREWEET